MTDTFTTAISNVLHAISQGLLIPDILILLALVCYGIFAIGSVIAEGVTEHRHYKVSMPGLMNDLNDAPLAAVGHVIARSALLARQKAALITLFDNRSLPCETRYALAKRLYNDEAEHYRGVLARTDMAAKIAPMFGLMGTLIPLGPGIVALGGGETSTLSSALLIAFDTTVVGLIVAAACLIVSRIRKKWYTNYLFAIEASMTCLLEKIDDAEEGIEPLPRSEHYSFLERSDSADEDVPDGAYEVAGAHDA